MKQALKSGIKIYLLFFLYMLVASFLYTLYLMLSNQDFSYIMKLIIGGIGFILLGCSYANAIHKKGLIIGMIIGIVHYFILKLIFFLAFSTFDFSFLLLGILTLCSAIGGLLGIQMKKIF